MEGPGGAWLVRVPVGIRRASRQGERLPARTLTRCIRPRLAHPHVLSNRQLELVAKSTAAPVKQESAGSADTPLRT